jgi:DDE superfamily endonuclease
VSEKMIQKHARAQYDIVASNKWVQGFMKRRGLRMRLRTTDKEVSTERIQTIAREYRNKHAALFATHSHALLFNMDETPIYLDAPGNRTVDRVGAKTVEIGTTKHEKDRVTMVICVSAAGAKVDALIIHRCYEKVNKKKSNKKKKKTNNLFQKHIPLNDGQITLWISYSPKAYMNHVIMAKWIKHIYTAHITSAGQDPHNSILFMDNMGSHDTEEIEALFTDQKLRTMLFPPNTTPLLQPLDHTINASLKREYE